VAPNPSAERQDQSTIARWDGKLALLSAVLEPDPLGRRMHHLHVTWRAETEVTLDLEIRARLVDLDDGTIIWISEGRRPVSGYTSTQAWAEGAVVPDYVPLPWPAWVPPEAYRLEVGVFRRFGRGLFLDKESTPWFGVGAIEIPANSESAPYLPVARPFGSQPPPQGVYADAVWLSSVDMPGEIAAGGLMVLDATWVCEEHTLSGAPWLRWISTEDPRTAGNVVLHPIGYDDAEAFCRAVNVDTVPVRYEVSVPQQSGSYRIEIGWGTGRAARCHWLGRVQNACPVGVVNVLPGGDGLANYDNKVMLLGAEVDPDGIPAGGPLRVRLHWRALRAMQQDYTVFVQVLGPDGKLYGQVDSWPMQGARPTRGWTAGEELWDAYEIYVNTDGPSGDYRVIVGWYLLADMARLPVIDAEGQKVGDYVVVDSFSLP
jgi:hypothetical protein